LLAACSPPGQLSDSGVGAYEASLAVWNDKVTVAWYDMRDGNAELYARALGPDGLVVGPELRLTTTAAQSYEADIAPLADGFAIGWYEKAADDSLRAWLGVWESGGMPRWSIPVGIGGGNSRNAVVRSSGDALFCAWIEADGDAGEVVWGGWWRPDGSVLRAPVRLGAASAKTWNLNAAVAAVDDAWVVFDAHTDTAAEELFLARLVDGNASLVRLSADDGVPSRYPDIGLAGARAAITWFDERDGNREVYLAAAAAADLPRAVEQRARRITSSQGASIGAYLAWNGDRIGLAWSDDSGGNYEVYFQPFDGDGMALAAARRITETAPSSMIPAIKPWRDGFALAWDEVVAAREGAHDEATRAEVMFTTVDMLD
jgi:hypothetical protein